MKTGVVRSFDRQGGAGLIAPEDGSADVPVHVSAVERSGLANLEVGDRVRYDTMRSGARGERFATNLQLL